MKDIQYDQDLCKHDAQIDAWEADWDLLKASFIQAAIDCGFTPEGYATIAETAAADIIDLHRPSAEYETELDKIMLADIDEKWIYKLGRK